MRLLSSLCIAAALAAGPAHAAEPWLTLRGDETRADVDTIQVNPTSMRIDGNVRTMEIRTSRTRVRPNGYDRQPYRSYIGLVDVDCLSQTASFRQQRYFMGPLWTGDSRLAQFAADQRPLMVFRDIEPNPTQRVVTAACATGQVTTVDDSRTPR